MKSRGILIVLVLAMIGLLAVLGFGYLGSRTSLLRAARADLASVQAEALAYAGLEDARIKLNHDFQFPPAGAVGQETFTYSEDVFDLDGNRVGEYTVVADVTFRHHPYQLVIIRSTGRVGSRQDPVAERTFEAEWSTTGAAPFLQTSVMS